MKRRAFGLLVDDHPLAGRIPRIHRPVMLLQPPGAICGVGARDLATRAAREGLRVPARAWLRLSGAERDELWHRGARPAIEGAGTDRGYRALGALFALATGAKTHVYILSSVTAGQQDFTITFLEASCDGTTGAWTVTNEGSTHAGAGTAGTAPTVTQMRTYPVTASSTVTGGLVGGNYTAEPSALQTFGAAILPLPTAPFLVQYPLGREIEANNTASAVMRAVAHRGVVSTGTPNMRSCIEFTE